MKQKKIISSFAIAMFSTIFVGGIFYLSDKRLSAFSQEDKMFSWGFVIFYFVAMCIGHLFMEDMTIFFKNLFAKKK
ncbi:hypothetical protein CHRY9390_00952 [Chryseobacterium aquaeductus]|uniref:Uncharacterized protein n=1 Tax=Chryseobacterium aquaeductus TaxID=2675056 RepID=A0A9N8MEV4_9FLAO|nr:hypothetical protein [Chryseobacterium aquaeductus]CAA7330290.1 hypothetical protein CHRY9390_00952 [Chryseobacterium potabilaquae]CAD7802602.1 hypothetical protein CHRY9390_00952 [Chryseobacterium aquaeductus]